MQLNLRPFYNILKQQNNFEWTTEHQTRFEELKTILTEQYQILFQIQTNHFMSCATPLILASVHHYYSVITVQTK